MKSKPLVLLILLTNFSFKLTAQDNSLPGLVVDDVQILEGHRNWFSRKNFNNYRYAEVTVRLTAPINEAVTFNYHMEDISAAAGKDYVAESGTIELSTDTFWPTATLFVPIIVDNSNEPNETLRVVISDATGGAGIQDGEGIVTIVNDDQGSGAWPK